MNGIMIDGDAALVLTFLFVVAGVCMATVLVLEVIKALGRWMGILPRWRVSFNVDELTCNPPQCPHCGRAMGDQP